MSAATRIAPLMIMKPCEKTVRSEADANTLIPADFVPELRTIHCADLYEPGSEDNGGKVIIRKILPRLLPGEIATLTRIHYTGKYNDVTLEVSKFQLEIFEALSINPITL